MDITKYLKKTPTLEVGVDIGFGSLKIALLQISPEGKRLLSYQLEDISQLKEEEKDSFILGKIEDFIKAHGLFKRTIHLNLPLTNTVFTKTIKLPNMPKRDIPNAAKWQVKDEISINLNDAEFAWQYISPQTKVAAARIGILCVIAKRDFLNKYVELFKPLNITLSEITFSPFSLNAIMSTEEEWAAVLDIGHKQSIFSMHSNKGRLLFLRTIHVGADNFKVQEGISEEQVKLNIEHISDEVVRAAKYCELEFTKQAINQIYITGGGAKIEALHAQLKEASGLDIKILRFPRSIQVDDNIRKDFENKRDSLQILPATGAAIACDSKINVLPLEARTAKLLLVQKISFRLIGFTTALILLLSFVAIQLNINVVKKRLNNAKGELEFLKEAEVLNSEIDDYNKVINFIKGNHVSPQWPLKFISSLMPENMVLSSFAFNNKDKLVNITGLIYTKAGSSEEAITEFIKNLKQVELFKDVQLVSIERTSSGNAFIFNIACNLEL